MPQPPLTPVQARELVRTVPFCAQRTYANLQLGPSGVIQVQWDVADGITDVGQLLVGNYPGAGGAAVPLPHATGPYLDAAAFIVAAFDVTDSALLTVEYAIDRGCLFRLVTPGTAVPFGTFVNISGLRITARFVRVTLTNQSAVGLHTLNVDFGVYVRSS
jgi:hypothetical protein